MVTSQQSSSCFIGSKQIMKMQKLKIYVAMSIVVLTAIGCANMKKEDVGTLAGVVLGGVIGKQVGGDTGMAAGLLIGGLLGNRIGAYMDEQDMARLEALEQNALVTGRPGKFIAKKSKARVSVNASKPTIERSGRSIRLARDISPQSVVLVEQRRFFAHVDTPAYASLNEKSRPYMVVRRGAPFVVIANVVNEGWALIGDDDVGLGYVPMRYLKKSIVTDSTRYGAIKPGTAIKTAQSGVNKPVSKQSISTKADPAITTANNKVDYDRQVAQAKAGKSEESSQSGKGQFVRVSLECKTIVRKVEPENDPSGSLSETSKYCKEPPKGWQKRTT
jgi:outer membrane lipoprotein SlyB